MLPQRVVSPAERFGLRFFQQVSASAPTLLALLANIFGLAAVFWLVLRAWRRWQNRWFHLIIHLLFFALLVFPLDFVRAQTNPRHSLLAMLHQPAYMFVAVVIGAFVLWKHRLVAKIATIVVVIFSPLAFFNIWQNRSCCVSASSICGGSQHAVILPPPAPVHAGQPRVVWIIFDEADYRMIYDQRPAGLELPEFDRLRGESLSADNAISPTEATITSMPSLILGYRVSKATLTNSSDLARRVCNHQWNVLVQPVANRVLGCAQNGSQYRPGWMVSALFQTVWRKS